MTSTDIDECETHCYDCHKYATCRNNPGSYDCICMKGFKGDGKSCRGYNENNRI